jgi:hypothetical protein
LGAGDVVTVEPELRGERVVVPGGLGGAEEMALDDGHQDHRFDERSAVAQVGRVAGRLGGEIAPAGAEGGANTSVSCSASIPTRSRSARRRGMWLAMRSLVRLSRRTPVRPGMTRLADMSVESSILRPR